MEDPGSKFVAVRWHGVRAPTFLTVVQVSGGASVPVSWIPGVTQQSRKQVRLLSVCCEILCQIFLSCNLLSLENPTWWL